MVLFVRFRPLTPNQKEQQPVLTSKPKTGSASASRSSKKSLKEDGKQFSTLNFACCGGLRLLFVCLIFDCSQKKSFCSLSFHLSEVVLSHMVVSLLYWPFCCCAWIQAVLCWALLQNCFGDFVLTLYWLLRLCEGNRVQGNAPKTIPYRYWTHHRPSLLLILSKAQWLFSAQVTLWFNAFIGSVRVNTVHSHIYCFLW